MAENLIEYDVDFELVKRLKDAGISSKKYGGKIFFYYDGKPFDYALIPINDETRKWFIEDLLELFDIVDSIKLYPRKFDKRVLNMKAILNQS